MKSSNRNKLLLLPVAIFILLLSVVGVNAVSADGSCGFQNPASNGVLNKFSAINVSFANLNGSMINISVYLTSPSSVNSSRSTGALVINNTNRTTTFMNVTMNETFVFPDAVDYTLDCQCKSNDTIVNCNSTLTGISVDRSNPEVNGVTVIGSNTATNLQTISFGFRNSTRWRFFHNNIVIQTTSVTSNIANASGSQQIQLRDSGSYYIEGFDGTNTTNSATISYTMLGGLITSKITKEAEVKKSIQKQKVTKEKSNKGILLIGAVIVVLVVVGGIMGLPKIRKKRK